MTTNIANIEQIKKEDLSYLNTEIILDTKVGKIFEMIDEGLLNNALSEDKNTNSEMKGIVNCIEKATEIERIYDKQLKEFQLYKSSLLLFQVKKDVCNSVESDLKKMVEDIKTYLTELAAFSNELGKGKITREHMIARTNQVHNTYKDFKKNNIDTINKLSIIKSTIIQ